MTAIELLERCRALDIRLWAESGELRGEGPSGAGSPWLSAKLSDHKVELLALLDSRDQGGREPPGRATEECATIATQGRVCQYCKSPDLALTMDAPEPHYGRLTCKSCGRGVGWAPTPLEFVPEWTMPIGKYRGNTLAQIAETDRGRSYLEWAAANLDQRRIREVIKFFLDHAGTTW